MIYGRLYISCEILPALLVSERGVASRRDEVLQAILATVAILRKRGYALKAPSLAETDELKLFELQRLFNALLQLQSEHSNRNPNLEVNNERYRVHYH